MREFSKELRRVVIKVGSSSITHENGAINIERIEDLVKEITNIKNQGIDVILVSSGAIASGRNRLGVKNHPRNITDKQAISSVGQVTLMNMYLKSFAEFGYDIGQILLTRVVETDETMRNNAQNTLETLLAGDIIPIVNENDTISTFEIKFGDNDTLSAVVARLVEADLLLLLTDIEGLYTDDPRICPEATLIPEVREIDENLRAMGKDSFSSVGTGGMSTKIGAAALCMEQGIDVIVASSKEFTNIRKIMKGEEIGTFFKK